MPSKNARLDRFIGHHCNCSRKAVRPLLAKGRVEVDGVISRDAQQIIGPFSHVTLDGQILQANTPRYIMLHKPAGVVSATRDKQHRTVMDLLPGRPCPDLHIAGRLDYHSTGLLLLSNDGSWSRRLSDPANRVVKRYRVTLEKPLGPEYVQAFAEGMYFAFENLTTRPAQLSIISDHIAEVGLEEGRYHQIKRMFGRFHNRVLSLHRTAIGNLQLDADLQPGESRHLSESEVNEIVCVSGRTDTAVEKHAEKFQQPGQGSGQL